MNARNKLKLFPKKQHYAPRFEPLLLNYIAIYTPRVKSYCELVNRNENY